jgi:hypothetical protein
MLFVIVPILAIILLFLNFLLAPHKPNEAKLCKWTTLPWLKLSNSGDPLKFMVPIFSRKAESG